MEGPAGNEAAVARREGRLKSRTWPAAAPSLLCYVAVTAFIGRHVLAHLATGIANDAGDPLLNAAILEWTARTLPLTDAWWQFPIFHPTRDALTFSEHLLGVSVVALPIRWMTGDPVVAYNLTILLTFPLSAMAMFALVLRLTGSAAGAFVAGLAYGFAPYRVFQLGHIQMLTVFWAPLALLGLHAYLSTSRRRWLVWYGVCWMLQVAANLYCLILFTMVVVLWVIWFVGMRRRWLVLGQIALATLLAALPLLPILYKYATVHAQHELVRRIDEVQFFSADLAAVVCAPDRLTFWGWLHVGCRGEAALFPGVTIFLLFVVAWLRILVSLGRSSTVSVAPTTAAFYANATVIMWLFTLGPTITYFWTPVGLDGPFGWLRSFPGGDGLRVPARFWLMSTLCLAVVAGIVIADLIKSRRRGVAAVMLAIVTIGVLADGWFDGIDSAALPRPAPDASVMLNRTVLELPLGTDYPDAAAEWRAVINGWTSVNGYSGHSPGYYAALAEAALVGDERFLRVFQGLSELHVIVREEARSLQALVERQQGATLMAVSAAGLQYRLPRIAPIQINLGQRLPIVAIRSACNPQDLGLSFDGDDRTRWVCSDEDRQEITIDLGESRTLGSVVQIAGSDFDNFPRNLAIDTSADDTHWRAAWDGNVYAEAIAGAIRFPRSPRIELPFEERLARYVRVTVRPIERRRPWSIAELELK
jgi:F5/8 type C domain